MQTQMVETEPETNDQISSFKSGGHPDEAETQVAPIAGLDNLALIIADDDNGDATTPKAKTNNTASSSSSISVALIIISYCSVGWPF